MFVWSTIAFTVECSVCSRLSVCVFTELLCFAVYGHSNSVFLSVFVEVQLSVSVGIPSVLCTVWHSGGC